jgi:ribulose-5-phosphate 4-epimerase/fuculose-1-phosphate aldolase
VTRKTLPARVQCIDDLVWSNRILVNEGILDGFGHVSVRDPDDARRFLIARSMAPALVTHDDVLSCDLNGAVHDERGRKTYLERFIHSEIYRARPDVQAVVHTHSPSLIPFGFTGNRLRPVCHMSSFLGSSTPVFEIRNAASDHTDLLIRSEALGKALVDVLGPNPVALMRGHGCVVVGNSLPQALFRAVYTEGNARIQAQAMAMGAVEYLTEGECEAATSTNEAQLERPWNLWKHRLVEAGRIPGPAVSSSAAPT